MIFLARFLILNILMSVLNILKSLDGINDKSKNVSIFQIGNRLSKSKYEKSILFNSDSIIIILLFTSPP